MSTSLLCRLFLPSLIGLSTLALSSATPRKPTPAEPLATLLKESKWQKRVLLLCAPTATDEKLTRQKQLLESVRPALAARDLVVRDVIVRELSAADQQYVRQKLAGAGTSFTLLLIGKDGGVKRRETEPIIPKSLFATIDVMPMRQQEMRGQR